MTKQFPALSALTLAGSPTTWLRRQCSSALEPRNFFLLVADIYRRISFATTKIRELLLSSQVLWGLESVSLRGESFSAANKKINANFLFGGFIASYESWCVNEQLCFVSTVVRNPDSYRDPQIKNFINLR